MSNHSVIEHRANYHFIKLEEDYLAICSTGKYSPHCKAFILAILEHWMNNKRANGEDEFVYMTIPQWIKYTYMLFGRNAIIDCLFELVEEGLIERRSIIMHDQETYEYKLKVDPIQARLKELREKSPKEVLPNLDACIKSEQRNKARRAEEKKLKEGRLNLNDGSLKINGSRLNTNERVVEKQTRRSFKNKRNLDTITELPTEITPDVIIDAANADINAQTPFDNNNQSYPHPETTSPQDIHTDTPSAYENHIQVRRQVGHDGITSLTFDDLIAQQVTEPQANDDPLHGPLFQAAGMFELEASEQFRIATTEGDTTHGRDTDTLALPVLNPGYQDPQHTAPQGQVASVGVATRNTESLVDVTQVAAPKPPKQKVPPGPLEMPPDDVRWCAEIAVQIVEFKKGRRYGEVTRKQELEKARQVLKYEVNGALLTRAQFIHAWDRMNEWPLWAEKNIAPMIKHLLKDDRIISLVQQKSKTPSGALTNGQKPRAAVLLPEHIANERKRKLLESTAAQRAEMDARQAARQAKAIGE